MTLAKVDTAEHRYYDDVKTYVDEETGELRISAPATTHKVVNIKQAAAYKEEQAAQTWRQNGQADFTASNMRNLSEVYTVLTTAQCGYLMRLQCNVSYANDSSNSGGTLVNTDKTPMTTADMRKVLQLTRKRSTFYDFINACLDHDIIRENNGTYSVNPRYHFRGAFSDQYVVKSYTARIKRVYREVKAADIGLIYRMLPFVHYGTNALCANPFEADPLKIEWFSGKELARAIGVHEKTLSSRLTRMKFGDEYVVARLKIGGGSMKFVFNPNVFSRKNTPPDDTLIAMFNVNYSKR